MSHFPTASQAAAKEDFLALILQPCASLADFGVGLASFHSKLPPEMENSLYSQL